MRSCGCAWDKYVCTCTLPSVTGNFMLWYAQAVASSLSHPRSCLDRRHARGSTLSGPVATQRQRNLVQAYQVEHASWEGRSLLLQAYTQVLVEGQFTPSEADATALHGIAREHSKPIHERFQAQHALSFVRCTQGRYEDSRKLVVRALRLAESATSAQRAEPHLAVNKGSAFVWITAGEHMDDVGVSMKRGLAHCAAPMATGPMPKVRQVRPGLGWDTNPDEGADITRGCRPWPVPDCHACGADQSETAWRAIRDRSVACSQCDASGVALKCCGTCRLAYYCSSKCQRSNWKEHKPQCRAPGEHFLGDIVRLQGLYKRPELNGQFARVIRLDPDKAGRWLVENTGWLRNNLVSVRQDCMRPVLTH